MDRKWWTLIAVCVGTFMLLLDVTIVNVALPDIQSSIHANFSDLQWVIDAYSLVLAALLLTTGSLADLFGRKRVFIIGLVIFTGSSLGSGLAGDPLVLNLFRGAQGVGGAAMFSTSLALLGSAFAGRERGTAFGIWGAITGLAVAIGPVIGGALTTGLSWRWIFLVNVPIGVIAVVLTVIKVQESRPSGSHHVDVIGVVSFSGALGALVLALIKADQKGWGSTYILVLLAGAVGGILLFLVAELVQGERAMFDLRLFRKPTFTGGAIAAFALSGSIFALFLYLTLYLQDVLRYSAFDTGLRFLVLSGGILLTSTLAGRLTASFPIRLLIGPGLALVGVSLLLIRGIDLSTSWRHLIPGFIVGGVGVGLINPPLASTAIGVVPPQRAGMASGINSTFRQVGIATGIAGLGTLFTHRVTVDIISRLRGVHGVSAGAARGLASSVAQGSVSSAGFGRLPASARPTAARAVKAGFDTGFNEIFLIGALLAFAGAVLTLVLIRGKDFETGGAAAPPAGAGSQSAEPATAGETATPATAGDGSEPAVSSEAPHEPADPVPVAAAAAEPSPAAPEAAEPEPPSAFRAQRVAAAPPAAYPPRRVAPEPAASTPEPPGPAAARSEPGAQIARSARELIEAAEQAVRDYAGQIEHEAARHREAELAAARARADELIARATERADAYEDALRQRLTELSAERDRLVARLREEADSAARYHDDAAELHRVIGELGRPSLPDAGAAGHVATNGASDGNGAANGAGAPRGNPAPSE